CAGDIEHESALDATMIRRNCATAVATRLASIGPGTDPAEVGDPPEMLPNVHSLYRDEASATFSLDAQRFTTLTTFKGVDGYFITNGNLMAPAGSDFNLIQYRRIVDRVCSVTYQRLVRILSSKIRTDPTPGPALGTIHPLDRDRVEKDLDHYNGLAVVNTDDAQAVSSQVSPTEKIIQTGRFPVSVGVTPFGYPKDIVATVGLVSPGAKRRHAVMANQFINGRLYSWSSIEVGIGAGAGMPFDGIKAINYSDNLDPGMPRGKGPLARGYTLGNYQADGDI